MGMVTDASEEHWSNALFPMEVTELGIVYDGSDFPAGYWISSVLDLLNSTPFSEEYLVLDAPTVMEVSEVHPLNTLLPKEVTESGMVTDVRAVHP